jgi:hypothetical protein
MLRGVLRTLLQVASIATLRKQRFIIFDDLKARCFGKAVLICGAGPSLKKLESVAADYDIIVGVNGLSRFYAGSNLFSYFFIEDFEAYLNYSSEFDEHKVILASGMPGHKHRQIPFLHFYGYPRFFTKPIFSKTGHVIFWAGSVIPFAVNVIALSAPRSIDILGFDLSGSDHFSCQYRTNSDLVNPTNWDKQRNGAIEAFSKAQEMGVPIKSIGDFKWPQEACCND